MYTGKQIPVHRNRPGTQRSCACRGCGANWKRRRPKLVAAAAGSVVSRPRAPPFASGRSRTELVVVPAIPAESGAARRRGGRWRLWHSAGRCLLSWAAASIIRIVSCIGWLHSCDCGFTVIWSCFARRPRLVCLERQVAQLEAVARDQRGPDRLRQMF